METVFLSNYAGYIWGIESDVFYNILATLLGVLGILLSVYFYRKSKKNKAPTYIVRTINLMTKKVKNISTLQVLYSGENVGNLSVTKVALWNAGKETVDQSDVAKISPMKIGINPEYKILDASILFQKNKSNNFRIELSTDRKYIFIHFDYFDYQEGIVVQIFHTGNESKDVFISGSLKSVECIKRLEESKFPLINLLFFQNNNKKRKVLDSNKITVKYSFIIVGLIMLLYSVLIHFIDLDEILLKSPILKRILSTIILSLFGGIYLYTGYMLNKRYIPKGFNIFNEEFLTERQTNKDFNNNRVIIQEKDQ